MTNKLDLKEFMSDTQEIFGKDGLIDEIRESIYVLMARYRSYKEKYPSFASIADIDTYDLENMLPLLEQSYDFKEAQKIVEEDIDIFVEIADRIIDRVPKGISDEFEEYLENGYYPEDIERFFNNLGGMEYISKYMTSDKSLSYTACKMLNEYMTSKMFDIRFEYEGVDRSTRANRISVINGKDRRKWLLQIY